MYEAIKNFHKQFSHQPEIKNVEFLYDTSSFIVIGMGGSALAPKLLKTHLPELDITVHSDYGLPKYPLASLKKKLIILSSYSGNTEEVIDAFQKGKDLNLNMAVITVGGELLKLAIENKIPYIELPNTGVQPRSALGFSVKGFLKLVGENGELKKITELTTTLNGVDYEEAGKALAGKLKNYVPVIYASLDNLSLAYNWKIKFNETGKIPAFYNVFPELNHNEMTGFDLARSVNAKGVDSTEREKLNMQFYIILLKDGEDDPRIGKRMEVLEKLYKDRNLKVEMIELGAKSKRGDTWHKVFSSLLLADWAAYYTAQSYGLEAEQVPMVEEFKKIIS